MSCCHVRPAVLAESCRGRRELRTVNQFSSVTAVIGCRWSSMGALASQDAGRRRNGVVRRNRPSRTVAGSGIEVTLFREIVSPSCL